MARDGESRREKRHERRTTSTEEEPIQTERTAKKISADDKKKKSKRRVSESSSSSHDEDSESSTETEDYSSSSSHEKRRKRKSSRRRHSDSESNSSESESESESESSESESERRRRKRKERKRREEKRRRREKDKKRKRRKKDDDDSDSDDGERRRKRKKKEKREKDEKKKRREKEKRGKIGAVTNSWGKFGVVREVDMWNKRPEFTAWLLEVKKVNLESLPNRDEKIMFKEYMEDYNTATFPSKKYYDLDAYHRRKMEKEMKKGFKKVSHTERSVFNDEEIRRQEMMQVREKQKEQEIVALKDAMKKDGMAQAMKEQARLKEEMVYLFKIGNTEAAAAIQRKLDPDVAM